MGMEKLMALIKKNICCQICCGPSGRREERFTSPMGMYLIKCKTRVGGHCRYIVDDLNLQFYQPEVKETLSQALHSISSAEHRFNLMVASFGEVLQVASK